MSGLQVASRRLPEYDLRRPCTVRGCSPRIRRTGCLSIKPLIDYVRRPRREGMTRERIGFCLDYDHKFYSKSCRVMRVFSHTIYCRHSRIVPVIRPRRSPGHLGLRLF